MQPGLLDDVYFGSSIKGELLGVQGITVKGVLSGLEGGDAQIAAMGARDPIVQRSRTICSEGHPPVCQREQ